MATLTKISKKEFIHTKSAELFLQNGFNSTSMREIAKAVGLEVSSLYNHINSKEEILKNICYDVAEIYLFRIEIIEKSMMNFDKKMEAILNLHIDMAIDYPQSLLVFNDEWKHMSKDNKTVFIDWRKEYEKKMLILINTGIHQNYIHKLDPELIIHSILAITKWAYKWMDDDTNRTKDTLKRDINKLFLFGLKTNTDDR